MQQHSDWISVHRDWCRVANRLSRPVIRIAIIVASILFTYMYRKKMILSDVVNLFINSFNSYMLTASTCSTPLPLSRFSSYGRIVNLARDMSGNSNHVMGTAVTVLTPPIVS